MGELEFKQQHLKKLEVTKQNLVEQWQFHDISAKKFIGAIELTESQIGELKREIQESEEQPKKDKKS